jgi:hypothetical protein
MRIAPGGIGFAPEIIASRRSCRISISQQFFVMPGLDPGIYSEKEFFRE